MAYVSVDVDLDEFDTDEIINELVHRIEDDGLTATQKNKLMRALKISCVAPGIDSLHEEMKMDVLLEIGKTKSYKELEAILNEQ